MAKANLLNTSTSTFLELIGNGRVYKVPPYQRDYSWTEEQWEDLWTDIAELVDRPEDTHYMGALVVEGRSDREFAVIDGQQRIATLSLLALAVINRLLDWSAAGTDAADNQQRAAALRARFIGEKDPASLVEASKLTLNDTDNAFYQDYLVQLRSPLNARGLPKSNRLLWECFSYFKRQVDAWTSDRTDGARLARLVSEAAGRQLMFIRIAVDDELNAYTVFETLNARGLELSATDLLKNYLFSRLKTPADLQALQRRWASLMATVHQERFPEFLRYHLQCRLPRVRSQRLFKLVRDTVRDGPAVFRLLDELERRAEVFAALFEPQHPYWIERRDCASHVRDLNVLRVRQMTPLVFAAWESLDQADFARVLKLLVVVLFRYSAVSGLNTNALEPVFHEAAKGLLERRLQGPAEVFAELRKVYVDDDRFERDFAHFAPDLSGQGKKLVRYVLARLESDASGRACDPDADPGTVEHVLPENPSAAWEADFPRELWERSVDRMGNLTWLEPAINRRIANADFTTKREAYRGSAYALSSLLPDTVGEEWTPARLDARQAHMARRAVHLWSADFACVHRPHDAQEETHRGRPPARSHQQGQRAREEHSTRTSEHAASVVGTAAAGGGTSGDLRADGRRSVGLRGHAARRPEAQAQGRDGAQGTTEAVGGSQGAGGEGQGFDALGAGARRGADARRDARRPGAPAALPHHRRLGAVGEHD